MKVEHYLIVFFFFRSNSDSAAAAAAALSELEVSMAEVLRQRQTQIKREHGRQMATLEEKLDEELEKAAKQAKERVSCITDCIVTYFHQIHVFTGIIMTVSIF